MQNDDDETTHQMYKKKLLEKDTLGYIAVQMVRLLSSKFEFLKVNKVINMYNITIETKKTKQEYLPPKHFSNKKVPNIYVSPKVILPDEIK